MLTRILTQILKNDEQKGFTLVELMMVFVIIGVILTFLIPRAYRASIESKYQLVRQTSTELASWANEWAEKELEVQPFTVTIKATSNLNDYTVTLGNDESVDWVADDGPTSNWQGLDTDLEVVNLRGDGAGNEDKPNTSVKDIMPQAKILTNPFNGLSVFSSGNYPVNSTVNHAVTGAIGCAYIADDGYNYFALLFQGTESEGFTGTNVFYAGQADDTLPGLRNGIFVARLMPQ